MKRLVWLLIAVFGTAFAQVQPVDLSLAKADTCCCCEDQAGACGMPDCAPVPAGCPAASALPQATTAQAPARRGAPAPQARHEPFFAKLVSRPAPRPALGVSPTGTPAACVPLFKAHCSFLI